MIDEKFKGMVVPCVYIAYKLPSGSFSSQFYYEYPIEKTQNLIDSFGENLICFAWAGRKKEGINELS